MTRLSRMHPYPGMIADDLALKLCRELVKPGDRVLDPFCGTGRTLLAAAQFAGVGVGIDTNPLATLLVSAKASKPRVHLLKRLRDKIQNQVHEHSRVPAYDLEDGRKVSWFSRRAKRELCGLIWFINQQHLSKDELRVVASVLSATAREVSYARQDQWKIHRITPADRSAFRKSACKVFLNRLKNVISEIEHSEPLSGSCRAILGDSRMLTKALKANGETRPFDLVFSSPPYGDSQTTVQYGGVSVLCLGVLKYLNGLDLASESCLSIDRRCLGGETNMHAPENARLHRFWAGEDRNRAKRRVSCFLTDLQQSCREIAAALKLGGKAVFVVARRTTGGDQLKLDRFIISALRMCGCVLDKVRKREIAGKRTPYLIHRCGNTGERTSPDSDYVATMREEYILFFTKASLHGPRTLSA